MKNKREIVGEGQYAVCEHQQFVDREGNLVRITRGSSNPVPVGEAYAFFDCTASKEEIEKEIPTIRNLTQTPNELELYLTEGTNSLKEDIKLRQIVGEAREAGIKYVMKANYPTGTNRQTADELAGILNQTYQSPLFEEGEEFRGGIFYKKKGQYISRD
jgi:hypothetical protein